MNITKTKKLGKTLSVKGPLKMLCQTHIPQKYYYEIYLNKRSMYVCMFGIGRNTMDPRKKQKRPTHVKFSGQMIGYFLILLWFSINRKKLDSSGKINI